jgi:hypothetical protein
VTATEAAAEEAAREAAEEAAIEAAAETATDAAAEAAIIYQCTSKNISSQISHTLIDFVRFHILKCIK